MFRGNLNAPNDAIIMMVDDEPLNMEVIKIFLEDAGYSHFILVDKSPEAIDIMRRERPDVVLLDLKMPRVSGFDILTAMRLHTELKYLPAIVLTSSTDAETKLSALELGATDFLAKPVDSSELALRLRNTLAAKAYLDQLAHYDALTGLPNRDLFTDRTDQALKTAAREQSICALLNIKIGRLREIKDTLGQHAGDDILKEAALRLEESVRTSDSVARMEAEEVRGHLSRINSDEFLLLMPRIKKTEDVALVAQRITASLCAPIEVHGQEVVISATVGIAAYPADGEETAILFRNAASAASFAEQTPGYTYKFYSEEFNQRSHRRLRLESLLRRALDHNELSLHYQPKIRVSTGEFYGVEALLRWNNRELGNVSSVEFIPVAEDTGLIVAIGDWVLHEACQQQSRWRQAGFGDLNVAVNLSVKQFHEVRLASTLQSAIDASGIDPQSLTLEVTESVLIGNVDESIRVLNQLKAMGPKLSIDDFGTGYSSLSYLRRFPVDELKIDRSFIMDVQSDERDAAIVSTLIFLAHSLGMDVVAEGVELQEQLEFLRNKNCDVYQGYFYSRPVPAQDLQRLLEDNSRTPQISSAKR